MSELELGQAAKRPSLVVKVFGDTADEIELAALDEARKLFGSDARLEIRADYVISLRDERHYPDQQEKYVATLVVYADRS